MCVCVGGSVPDCPARVVYYEPLGITGTGILLYDIEQPDLERETAAATTASS